LIDLLENLEIFLLEISTSKSIPGINLSFSTLKSTLNFSVVLVSKSMSNELPVGFLLSYTFAVIVLQDYVNNHKVIFSHKDLEMITELERMTYTKTQTGEVVYKTLTPKGGKRGEDHNTSALLCAVLSYYVLIEGQH
jgi:hypothetical protein